MGKEIDIPVLEMDSQRNCQDFGSRIVLTDEKFIKIMKFSCEVPVDDSDTKLGWEFKYVDRKYVLRRNYIESCGIEYFSDTKSWSVYVFGCSGDACQTYFDVERDAFMALDIIEGWVFG